MQILVVMVGLLLTSWVVSSPAGASVLNQSSSHYFVDYDRLTLVNSTLGANCVVHRFNTSEVPCNPALMAWSEKPYFAGNFSMAGDYEILYKNSELLSQGKEKREVAYNLISEKKPLNFEGGSLLWYRHRTFGVVLEPLRWTYFSSVSNSSYPDVALHAMQEQSVSLIYGGITPDARSIRDAEYSFGVRTRFVDRKFVHETFNLFDMVADSDSETESSNYLKIKKQTAVYLEPGMTYSPKEIQEYWSPMLGVALHNVTIYQSKKYEEIPTKPWVDIGVSIAPPGGLGQWEISLTERLIEEPVREQKLVLGSAYNLGLISLSGSVEKQGGSLGILAAYKAFSAGFSYSQQTRKDVLDRPYRDDSGFIEFRVVL